MAIGGTPCPPGYTKVLFAGLPTCEKRTATGVLRAIQGQPKPEIIRRAAAAAQVAAETTPIAVLPPPPRPTNDVAAQEVEPMPKSFASVNIAPPGFAPPDASAGFNLGGAIVGGLTGLLTGGPGGALVGAVGGSGLLGEGSDVPDVGMPGGTSLLGGCPPGYRRASDGGCAPTLTTSVQAALPGGASGSYPSGSDYGGAVMGAFGVPALQPAVVTQTVRRCPPGAVLGRDGLCYTKGSIPPKYRAYRPKPKPVVSRADFKAIQRADRARKRLINLTKKAGAFASMKKPSTSRGSRGVITKSEAARALRK